MSPRWMSKEPRAGVVYLISNVAHLVHEDGTAVCAILRHSPFTCTWVPLRLDAHLCAHCRRLTHSVEVCHCGAFRCARPPTIESEP